MANRFLNFLSNTSLSHFNMSSSLLFPDEDGNSVPEKNSTLMGHFEKLPNFEFKNSKNLSKVIKFIKRKQHQITIHNTKIFNKALDCIFMNYILMCSSKIQEFEPDIKPEEEQDFFKYALSFLNHVFTFIPREEILRG
uniref:Uncharacterized protein n=1 Tax=Megaselia scalaris TaxID=36166 RepID=T1GMJ8_MEGSC